MHEAELWALLCRYSVTHSSHYGDGHIESHLGFFCSCVRLDLFHSQFTFFLDQTSGSSNGKSLLSSRLRVIQTRRSGLRFPQWTVVLPQTDGKISTSALMQSTGENADCCCSSLNESLDYSAFQPSTFPSTEVVFNSFDCWVVFSLNRPQLCKRLPAIDHISLPPNLDEPSFRIQLMPMTRDREGL